MAEFSDDLENYLRTTSEIALYSGWGVDARVFNDVPDQGTTLPFIVFTEAGGESIEHLTGGAGLCQSTWHIFTYGVTRKKANEFSEVVKNIMRPYKGLMGGTHVSEISFSGHRLAGVDLPQDNLDQKRYWTRRVADIWHQEST